MSAETNDALDLARTLERSLAERTEERDALKKAISEGTRLDYVVKSYEAMASALIAERDIALAKLAAFSKGYVDSAQHNDMAKKLAAVTAERDALKKARDRAQEDWVEITRLYEREVKIERDALLRGEYICKKCGIRKDGEGQKGDF